MDELWMAIQPPRYQEDPYYPEFPMAYNPIPPVEEVPMQHEEIEIEEDPEEDPEEDMEEDPEDDDDDIEVIMLSDSESAATPPSTPIRSFAKVPSRHPRKTARMSIPDRRTTTQRQNKRSSYTQERIDRPAWESNMVNKWISEKKAAGTFEKGQASGAAPPSSMDIDDLSFLFEQNTRLNGQVWHISDELSTMQGQTVQMKEGMARIEQQQSQYEASQELLYQRMGRNHDRWMSCDARMTSLEDQNQIAFSIAHGVEERHAMLEERHTRLEEKHAILEGNHAILAGRLEEMTLAMGEYMKIW